MPVETSWNDETAYDTPYDSPGAPRPANDNYLEAQNPAAVTVQTHLLEQVNLIPFSDRDKFIALSVIDGLNEDGVLETPLDDILAIAPDEWLLELDEVEAVLHLIQHLDPVGVAARSLEECLTIQLQQLPASTPCRDTALTIVSNHLAQLAGRDYVTLARKLHIRDEQLKQTLALIQSLSPRPGSAIATPVADYVEPDVMVSKQKGKWMVELNPKSTPRIRVNPDYAKLIKRGDTGLEVTNLRNYRQEAQWFIKSLQQRNSTLLRVAGKIVEYQRGFLEHGDQAMKPLVLHDIADALELHESTISRVTTQKYMLTPRGLYELKYFFSSHVSTHTGGEVSSTAIKALLKELIAAETPHQPLSDSKIAKLLEMQNINIARRTVAKYRESLNIPPSNERKQLI